MPATPLVVGRRVPAGGTHPERCRPQVLPLLPPSPTSCYRTGAYQSSQACLASHDVRPANFYISANHYWTLQWEEAAIYAGATAVLLGLDVVGRAALASIKAPSWPVGDGKRDPFANNFGQTEPGIRAFSADRTNDTWEGAFGGSVS